MNSIGIGAKWIWRGRCDKEKKATELDRFPFKNPVVDWKNGNILIWLMRRIACSKIVFRPVGCKNIKCSANMKVCLWASVQSSLKAGSSKKPKQFLLWHQQKRSNQCPTYSGVEAQVTDVTGDDGFLLGWGHSKGVVDHCLLHRVHLHKHTYTYRRMWVIVFHVGLRV